MLRVLEDAMNDSSNILLSEGVSLRNHSLWCAYQAHRDKCTNFMIVAAMFHDFGHYICAGDSELTAFYTDKEHAALGAAWLSRWFPAPVYMPIAMHIEAKRYLFTTDIDYRHSLGRGSRQSLEHQGGPMSQNEICVFLDSKYSDESLMLRRFDDAPFFDHDIPPYKWYESIIISTLS